MSLKALLDTIAERTFEPSDAVVDNWAVSNKPWLIYGILAVYLAFVTKLGPMWMKNREPYKLRRVMMAYNFFQVVICIASVIVPFLDPVVAKGFFSMGCSNILDSGTPEYYEARSHAWWYLIIKLTDLCDTVFMVLRKKQKQVTFLHVYHHMSVTIIGLFVVRYVFGVHLIMSALLNCIVHIFMYFYYFLAGFGPQMQKHLWWKKYITVLQLVQFVGIVTWFSAHLLRNCQGNRFASAFILLYSGLYVYLFGKFYVKSYGDKDKKKNK